MNNMSVITNYQCNSKECNATTSMDMNFPIWKSDSPEKLRMVPVGSYNKEHVAGYVNRGYCTIYKDKRPCIVGSTTCLVCNNEDAFVKGGGLCPRCNKGTLEEKVDERIWF